MEQTINMVVAVYSGLTSRLRTISHAVWVIENSDDREKELTVLWPITNDCHINGKKVFTADKFLGVKIKVINYRVKPVYKPIDIRREPVRSMAHMGYNIFADFYGILFGALKAERLKKTRDVYDYDPPAEIGWEGKGLYDYAQSVWRKLSDRLRISTDVYIHAYCGIVMNPDIEIAALYGIDFLPQYYDCVDNILGSHNREDLVGVHIRRTDHKRCISNSPLQLFTEKMDELTQQNRGVCFFLATDDKKTQEELVQKYGKRIIVQNKVWGRDSKKAMVGGIIDCLCLSKCKMVLGSDGSVFSDFAAKCGGIEMISMTKQELL